MKDSEENGFEQKVMFSQRHKGEGRKTTKYTFMKLEPQPTCGQEIMRHFDGKTI